jgi:hypothetical protein
MNTSNPTPQDGGKQEQAIRTKLKPVYAELRDCSVARVYLADAVDGVLAQRDAALLSSVNSIAGMRERVAELEGALKMAEEEQNRLHSRWHTVTLERDSLRARLAAAEQSK